MMRRRAPRILLEGAPQHPLTLRIPAGRSIEIREVHRSRRKGRVHLERRPQRHQELRAQRGVDALEGARRRAAHHRVAVLEPRADDLEGRRARRRTEARSAVARTMAGWSPSRATACSSSVAVAPAAPIEAAPSASP